MERVLIIERVVHSLHASHSLVTDSYTPPSLVDDLDDINIGIFGGNLHPEAQREIACEMW